MKQIGFINVHHEGRGLLHISSYEVAECGTRFYARCVERDCWRISKEGTIGLTDPTIEGWYFGEVSPCSEWMEVVAYDGLFYRMVADVKHFDLSDTLTATKFALMHEGEVESDGSVVTVTFMREELIGALEKECHYWYDHESEMKKYEIS